MYHNDKKYALTNCVLLDGSEHMEPQTGKAVCIAGEKISEIVDAQHIPAGYEAVDLGGKYVLPGLINMHVHLPASGRPKKKASDPKKLVKLITFCALTNRIGVSMCEGYAKTELLSGVTTIRTVGGVADYDTKIRDLAAAGKILAPRVLASNMAVSVPGGHMAGSLAYEAHSAEEAAALVEKIAAEKPDLIKLMITGGVLDAEVVGEPGVLRMQPELVKAASDKAHSLGMIVAAHVESPEGVMVALQNGVDSIEHGAQPSDEMITLFKQRKAFQISTISPALPYALFDRSISHAARATPKPSCSPASRPSAQSAASPITTRKFATSPRRAKFLPRACWRRTWRSPSPAGTWRVRSPTRRTPPKRPRRSSKRSPPKSPTSSS